MAYSTNTFTYVGGAQTFTLSLSLGYIKEADIEVFVVGELDGGGEQLYRTFTFDSEFVVLVTESLTVGDEVTVQRTVSKDTFEVDFESGGDITAHNLMLLYKQTFMIQQELLDGRIDGDNVGILKGDLDDAIDLAASQLTDAQTAAAAALVSETNADASETAAAASKVAAAASAVTAATEATTATAQAVIATTQAGLASASESVVAASAVAAAASAADADADAIQVAADLVLTDADQVSALASKVGAAASEALTDADAITTAADRVQTGLDIVVSAGSVAAALVSENNSDASKIAAAASAAAALVSEGLADADRVQTGIDAVATGADAIATAADLVSLDGEVAAAATSATASQVSRVASGVSAAEALQSAIDAEAAGGFDPTEYAKVDGSQAFTAAQGGIVPTLDAHLAIKGYVDDEVLIAQIAADLGITNAATADAKAVFALADAVTADAKAVAAQGTADTAVTNAATADGKAVSAQGTADTAVTSAATADAKAVVADAKAVTADAKAVVANTDADTADAKAVAAQATADTGVTNAATADAKAVTADAKAVTANTDADTADAKAVAAQATADGRATVASVTLKANKNNAALTGVPTAPTPADNTDTTQIATTAFVKAQPAVWNSVDKDTNQSVTSSSVPIADNSLFFTMEANTRYIVVVRAMLNGTGLDADWKVGCIVPSDAEAVHDTDLHAITSTGGTSKFNFYEFSSYDNSSDAWFDGNYMSRLFWVSAGATGGVFYFAWSQKASSGQTVSINKGNLTYMKAGGPL